ncbi:unnamed protein product [Rhodiola kirilowii]
MANPPPAGRWMRMATLRPMSNPTQDPPSPQPPAPRPVLGRTFTAVPFRPAVATAPAPASAIPPAPVVAPPRQGTPTLPVVTAIRPPSVRLAAGTISAPPPPPPQGAPNTLSVTNAVPSPQRAPIAATVTNNVPSPQRAPVVATVTNGVPSPQRAPNASTINGVSSPQRAPNASTINGVSSPQRAPATLMPNFVPSPQPAPPVTVNDIPTPQKTQFAPSASPVRQTSPMFIGDGVQQPQSPQANAPPAPLTITNPSSPFTRATYAPNFVKPKSPSQKQPSTGFSSPTASPSTKKQVDTSPNFTSAPAPRMVTFSSPTKSPVSPAASTPRIPSPIISPHNTFNPPDRTPPQSPQTLSMTHPPSPLHLPPPQLRSDTEQDLKIPPEPEQKSILFQHSPEKHKHSSIPNQKSPQITKHQNDTKSTTKDRHPHKKQSDSEEIGRSIITIAGENRGALMDLGRPRNTHPHPLFPGNPHKLTSPNSKISGSESDQSSGSSGKPKAKDAISAPMKAFMNSNVQGINNSIMFNSTVTHNDPGVHVALSRKHKGHGGPIRHYKEHTDGHQS